MVEYQERDLILRDIGFASYADYLASDLWKRIRQDGMMLARRICCKCGGMANEIHHSAYSREVLLGLDPSHLHAVCGTCHEAAEFKKDGTKRPLFVVNRLLGVFGPKPVPVLRKSPARAPSPSLCPCGNHKKRNSFLCKPCQANHEEKVRSATLAFRRT